jgi:predicted nucleic acid-binding protein
MSYLIDTCVISELRKRHCHPGVEVWMKSVRTEDAFLSVLTLGEIRRGIERQRFRDPVAAAGLEAWLVGLETHYEDRLLPVSAAIADRWGRLSVNQPLPVTDGLLAATGLEFGLTIVTRNTSDFERSGVQLFDPFG